MINYFAPYGPVPWRPGFGGELGSPWSNWEDLEYDIERAFDGQMKNLDRVWQTIDQ